VLILSCEVWKKFFAFIFQLSGWALMTPSRFEDKEASLSNYWSRALSTVAMWLPTGLLGALPNS